MSKFTSNAEWTKTGRSQDTHSTKDMADGVCESLIRHYGVNTPGCDVRGKCLRAWSEEVKND